MAVDIVLFLIVLATGVICLGLAFRCCGVTELPLIRRTLALAAPPRGLRGERFTLAMGAKALAWGLGMVAFTYLASFMVCVVQKDTSWEAFLGQWLQWDANNYMRIAQLGYGGMQVSGMYTLLAFFPLYPWLIRLLHPLIPDWQLCGQILSCLCYVGAMYMFARLVTEDLGWPAARLAMGLLSVWPFAFFFAAPFAESLFLLLTVTGLWLIRRHKWLWAGVVGALAAMTRMQGALLIFAGAVEYCVWEDPFHRILARDWAGLWRGLWHALLPLAITLVGVGVYLFVNWRVTGEPFYFVRCEEVIWHQGFMPLPGCLHTIWHTLQQRWGQTNSFLIWLPEIVVFAVSFAALAYSLRRLPPVWTAYLLGCTMLNFSLAWPLSCGRYTACTFPLFAAGAVSLRERPLAAQLVTVGSALLQAMFLLAYINGRQVM